MDRMTGGQFREIRKAMRLRQCDLGEILACSRQHICMIENEKFVSPVMALAIRYLEQTRVNEAA